VKLSDAVICVSRAQEKIVSAKLPSLRNKMHVIYNPLPEIQYVSLEGDGLAYFGGPSIFKGFHVLCKALKGLKGRRITVSATGFKNVEEQTMKFPNGTILEKRPWVDREALERIYRSIRAVIIPSVWSEPLPYVTYEALLKGRLVIASNIGGIPEQVLNYAGCFLFTPGKHLELADKIDHVSSMSREEVSEIGQRNRKMMLNQNINEKSLCSFLKILDDL
jgi:glycosyltransferase involved in cell wall biosynthesis